ncbi:hypothetical protein J2W40_003100 [Sphingobium xenophagum]|uniref:Right handed beta helix domain-containing protein n=1 Tax=Sphingobium xenophagum TaxID=121428 RepID=A0ABU1X3V4_SPHXE|nr:right-handed parallel beta-helix repeat-containing protein [Sphingobium xenophagum]MDR7156259.1 hypothetical protein [Sphingobium xenophagum]
MRLLLDGTLRGLGRRSCALLVASLLATGAVSAHAANYYIDANLGQDSNDGSATAPWRSLGRVNATTLRPGDHIFLAAGSVWKEPLVITRSGRRDAPITVGATGIGQRPRIDAGGVAEHGVAIMNAEYVRVSGLEVTNDGPPAGSRFGVLVAAQDSGVMRGIRISDMYIHDVRGTNDRKDNGGIVFSALGPKRPTRFEDIHIERNIVWRVDRSGIAGISDQVTKQRWFPSAGVVIRDNLVEDVGGDGIVPRGTDGALIEHNIVRYAGSRAPGYTAAIWQWSTDHSLIQFNEAAFTRTRYDGQGFDSDFNSRRTTIAYNYSHDNAGGFLLVCSPKRSDQDNLGNRGTVARSNVSRNDGSRAFQLAGTVTDVLIEGNVVHVGPKQDIQMVIATQWDGWASDVRFRNNVFAVAGTVRYGHEVGRNGPDYLIQPGFGPATQIRFQGNRYLGRHIDPPQDEKGVMQPNYVPPPVDWAVPVFDPAKPDGFAAFMVRHRGWMERMLARELGAPVTPLEPMQTSFVESRR